MSAPSPPSLHHPAYWSRVVREASQYRWSHASFAAATMCLPVIAAWLIFGILLHRQTWGLFAVAGAVTASFGAFQKLGESRIRPMLALFVGMALFTWLGSVVAHLGWVAWTLLATLGGFAFGALTALGYGGWWLGLQWMIALLVFGSHPAPPPEAATHALAVALGGAAQLLFLAATRRFSEPWFTTQDQPPWDPVDSLTDTFLKSTHPGTTAGGYALRVAVAMALSALLWHVWALPNGYWTPMTAAILLKPDLHEVTTRGFGRLLGTLTGAGLITLIVALARPGPFALGALLLLSVWACLALLRVNYALFVLCITAYVVLMLSLLGLPEPAVALRRVEATLAGATIALLVHLLPPKRRTDKPSPQTDLSGLADPAPSPSGRGPG